VTQERSQCCMLQVYTRNIYIDKIAEKEGRRGCAKPSCECSSSRIWISSKR